MNGSGILRVVFLTRSLDLGGAERQLVETATGLKRAGHTVTVLTFYPGGALERQLEPAAVPVISLEKGGRWDVVPFFLRLLRVLRQLKPGHLYAFLGVPCIVSTFAGLFLPAVKIVWGVRSALMDLSRYELLSRLLYRVECFLSSRADLIIANSHAGRDYAVANGFPSEKLVVIPNGFDTEKFRINRESGQYLRSRWGVQQDEKLVGLVARLDVMKDHPNFIRAAGIVAAGMPKVKFVCVGDGPEAYKKELKSIAAGVGLGERLIWAGACEDMPAVYNALDAAALSSYGEGFPNVVGEAMACGIPCVVTAVGDAAWLVGDTGVVVSPRNPMALANGIMNLFSKNDAKGSLDPRYIRNRICENFGTDSLMMNTAEQLCRI